MEFTGKIIMAGQVKSGVSQKSGNSWMTQDYVIEETVGNYPKRMCFSVFGEDRIKRMGISVGQELTVSFDIDAKEFNGKWYNELRAWKVESTRAELESQATEVSAQTASASTRQLTDEEREKIEQTKSLFDNGVKTDNSELPF